MKRKGNIQWRLTGIAAGATLLTSLSLSPTMSEGTWGGRLIGVVLCVALIGGAARHVGMPNLVTVLMQTIVLAVAISALYASDVAIAGVFPGPGTWHELTSLLSNGFEVVWDKAPPVSVTDGVSLLVVAGVGVIAICVDALAVTWSRATLAGLPLFVLYLVPAAVLPDGVPWPLFALSAVGWLLLLLAEGRDRLSRWGKLIGTQSHPTSGLHAVGGTGRRIGVTALAAAVAFPILLPALDEGVLGTGGSSGEGTGGSGAISELQRVVTINPLVDVRRNLVQGADDVVLRYTTSDTEPGYLRIATLDQFNGTTWTLEEMEAGSEQQADDGLPNPPGLIPDVPRTAQTSSVNVLGLDSPRLPLPYPVSSVAIDGDWRWDAETFDVFSAEDDGSALNQTYDVSYLDVSPTPDLLRAAPLPGQNVENYLQLSEEVQFLLADTAQQVSAGEPSQYDQALALQNWFRTKFAYSLAAASGNNENDLTTFLTDRSGYCEQFAATMGLMARTLGIPSRLQVGFTPGEQLADGSWEVTAHDAHAWPELWFDGVGWVRFEPTPGGGDGGATPNWAPPAEPTGIGPNQQPSQKNDGFKTRKGTSPLGPADRRTPDDFTGRPGGITSGTSPTDTGAAAADSSWSTYLAIVLVLALCALALPAAARRYNRRRRWGTADDTGAAAFAAWQDVLDTAADVDLAPSPTETPRDLARRLPRQASLSPEAKTSFVALAHSVELARYSPRSSTADVEEIERLRTTGDALSEALLSTLSTKDRRKARWWPASGRSAVAAGWNQGRDELDENWAKLRGHVSSRLRRA